MKTIASIDAQIKQLEAEKKLVARAAIEVPKVLDALTKFAEVLTSAQRSQIARIVGDSVSTAPAKAAKRAAPTGKASPKFRLPTGEVWSGRGRPPKAFTEWPTTEAGIAWAQANADSRFPPIGAAAPAAKKASKKTAAKKATGKKAAVKKAGKKAAGRKAVNTAPRKATKKAASKKISKKVSKRAKKAFD